MIYYFDIINILFSIDSAKTHQSSDQLRRRQYRIALNFFNKFIFSLILLFF